MKIDEIQCIKELRNGSYQAFTQIYEAYADRLYSFVLKQLKNRSLTQDIVQDTFLRLWDNRSQLNYFHYCQTSGNRLFPQTSQRTTIRRLYGVLREPRERCISRRPIIV